MKNKNSILTLVVGVFIGLLLMYLFKTYTLEKKSESTTEISGINENSNNNSVKNQPSVKGLDVGFSRPENSNSSVDITALTQEKIVVRYVKDHHRLPDYYIKKSEARRKGWNPSKGNLCDVLPGKAIGGDYFSNREGTLPKGNQYFEADINYRCGHRQTDRMIFNKKGEIWITYDHYKTFQKQ